ncbi:MAG: SDR family oxidoreductase [Dehalococcoidia bacterium]|nr:SDR family oxidoreductase [Dehalococcoidia bacterium]
MSEELGGSVALVTGGARNIGRAIAVALAAGGASVMVNANTSRQAAEETVTLIENAGGAAAVHIADVSNADAVRRMVDATVERFGRLDILVNNAAIRAETPLAQIDLAEWRQVMGVILEGSFLCSQGCLPHIAAAGGGTIINIGGQTGHTGAANRAHVVAAKAGLVGLTKALALELAPQRITVNLVVPGTIDTVRGLPGAPERPPERQVVPPIGRRGYPEDVASMVRLLCGPSGRYITGQTVHINGGGSMF